MEVFQESLHLKAPKRGFMLITSHIEELVRKSGITTGVAQIFIKHTSASLSINENADPSVREDFESFFNDLADDKTYYIHTYEGADDMPAHIKSSLLGSSLSIPISQGGLALGTWQGIYLGEHRDRPSKREIVVTLMGV